MEPFIRWINQSNIGYKYQNNKAIKVDILAFIDDLIILADSRE